MPVLKALLAAASMIPLVSASPVDDAYMKRVHFPLVHQVICMEGAGTAFRIGPTRFISAAHVTTNTACRIDGSPITIIEQDRANDFAIIEAGKPKGGAIKINCDGLKPGWYWGVGYARALPYQTAVAAFATVLAHKSGMRFTVGKHHLIPGMSGGPMLNEQGEAVGIVNAYFPNTGVSLSRSLSDTSVCK